MIDTRDRWGRRDLLRLTGGSMASAMVMASDTVRAIYNSGLSARELGARFDGLTDDTAALQRGIDEAGRQQRCLVLPSGTARLNAPLDIRSRHVALLGDPTGNTILRAGRALPCLLDAEDVKEAIDSPLFLYGLTLDGGHSTAVGIRVRYRHRTVFDTLAVERCETGVDERDSWLSRRVNCRTRATTTGWRLSGSNHSSLWVGCSFTDARDIHLDIGEQGSADDGNDALFFQACDIEYGTGDGVHLASRATATFDTCYLGEGINGDVLCNAGIALIRGGALFVGNNVDSVGIRLLAGQATLENVSVRGQQFGALDRLASGSQARSDGGKVNLRSINLELKLGGDPIMPGDILGSIGMRVFAPVMGRNWRSSANDAVIDESITENAQRIRCQRVTDTNTVIGLAATLQNTAEAHRGSAAYIVIVYEASAPIELKATSGVMSKAPWRLIGTLPATQGVATYVKADVPVEFEKFTLIELLMRAKQGDEMTLHHATISDFGAIGSRTAMDLATAR